MKAMILEAGHIGKGSVSELLHANQVETTCFDINSAMVDRLNGKKEYIIHVPGAERLNAHMEDARAHLSYDIGALCGCWKEVDFLFTAYGGKGMGNVGETLAKVFKRLVEENVVHVSNIVTCESWIGPAEDLKGAIVSDPNEKGYKLLEESVGVSEFVIVCTGTGAPNPDKVTGEMDTWVQNTWYLPIGRDCIKEEISQWNYVGLVTDFGDLLKQKIYMNNTSAATISYLGKLKGLTYVADSVNDPKIKPVLDQVYEEINYTLVHGMGINEESQIKFSKAAKAKYTDRAIVDPVTRTARNSIRKLKPQDRFIGPIRITLFAGVKPKAIVLGVVAALYFGNSEDRDVLRLKEIRETKGVDHILETIFEIDPQGEITMLIKETIAELKARGWVKEGTSA